MNNAYLQSLESLSPTDIPIAGHRLGDQDKPPQSRGRDQAGAAYERKAYPRYAAHVRPLPSPDGGSAVDPLSRASTSAMLAPLRLRADGHGGAPQRDVASPADPSLPIECYLIPTRGPEAGFVHYYDADDHATVRLFPVPDTLLASPPEFLGTAGWDEAGTFLLIALTGVVYRTMRDHGARGYRYVLLEAGAMAEAVELAGRGLGLRSTWLGGFNDSALCNLLGLRPALDMEIPLLLLAVATGDRGQGTSVPVV
ncbi:nitroreductase family protein [Streptomyces sp. DvalAA-19]|uniref:nitroreductase family protein n=1 Tax=Streptomyces sp. DvalAA-19 TaxID=1839761 RepID=UPI00081B5FB6|nr:nitroreductase family protein [Streptomyces sp. DvalAA-19]SCE02814.1 Nitroreductase family protein [Streptomyces sp. DvalAA-19]